MASKGIFSGAYSVVRTALVALILSSAAGAVTASPAPDTDLPGVVANLESIPAGSLVIAMDSSLQALSGTAFNLRAYGLVNALLQTNIPMKWAITAGKAKDGLDFSAKARRIFPTATAVATVNFRSGPFIVHRDWVARAMPVINAFGGSVAVYELTTNATVDVRYTLGHKPRVLVLDDGGTEGIHTKILQEAGFLNSQYAVVSATDVQSYAVNSCYTIVTAPHFKSTGADAETRSIRAFLEAGGNLLAQCAAVRTYENNSLGHFHGSAGLADDNRNSSFNYLNADLPFLQFDGVLADEGGSLQDWTLGAGSAFVNSAYMQVQNATDHKSMRRPSGSWFAARRVPSCFTWVATITPVPNSKITTDAACS
ncbi:MAG TPA: hypothetical protein VK633_10755 [Verrucomicrobiae bacterium]|nr:hypothetical protein [Verrucomicrobiae bacterium]